MRRTWQVDWLVIKIKQIPFLLFSMLFALSMMRQLSDLIFSALSLVNIRTLLLLFLNLLAVGQANFFHLKLGKHQTSLLLFRRRLFSHRNLLFQVESFLNTPDCFCSFDIRFFFCDLLSLDANNQRS